MCKYSSHLGNILWEVFITHVPPSLFEIHFMVDGEPVLFCNDAEPRLIARSNYFIIELSQFFCK